MEEILASIRRIIAEDEKPGEPALPAEKGSTEAAKDDVLELTEMIGDDGTIQNVSAPDPAGNGSASPEPPLPDGRIEPEPPTVAVDSDVAMVNEPAAPRTAAAEVTTGLGAGRILSTATSGAAAAAFARLATMPRERRAMADVPLGSGDRTLEDIVRETLRPLLQAWLDENLPELVERLVRAEIARVVGEAGLR
jgi:uncharacterized protein